MELQWEAYPTKFFVVLRGVGWICDMGALCCSSFVDCGGDLSACVRDVIVGFEGGYVVEFDPSVCYMAMKSKCW